MLYRVIDQHVVSEGEYQARAEEIDRHLVARLAGKKPVAALSLSGGRQLGGTAPSPPPVGFTPIGPNLPLTVEIRHVYTGKFPERAIFGHRGDMAIVSGVKNYSAFDATARAVNFLETGVAPGSHFDAPTVFSQGTPVILYSPAVIDSALTFGLEMAVANGFPRELLEHLSSAFQTLAGVPVLLPYAGYLLGASSVVRLGEGVADALYQSQPAFNRTEVINFTRPGSPAAAADWRIVCNSALKASDYGYVDGAGLVDAAGAPYAGEEPYVVISLDGAARDDLKGFTPAVASATVLARFFQMKDGAETAIDTLVSAVGIYSDLKYRRQADQLKAQIASTADAAQKAKLQATLDAVVKNIAESALRPA